MITTRTNTTAVFRDLVHDTLKVLLPVVTILAWAWTSYVIVFDMRHTLTAYTVFILILGSSIFAYWQYKRRFYLAIGVYLIGILLALTQITVAYPNSAAFYLYIPLVLLCGRRCPKKLGMCYMPN